MITPLSPKGHGDLHPSPPRRSPAKLPREGLLSGGFWVGPGNFLGSLENLWIALKIHSERIRVRRRSGEGVLQRSSRPKGCFWRVRFFSANLRFALKAPENLGGGGVEKKRTLQNNLLDDRFSARRLLRSFGVLPQRNSGQVVAELLGSSVKFWDAQELPEGLGKLDSLPLTHHIVNCLQNKRCFGRAHFVLCPLELCSRT